MARRSRTQSRFMFSIPVGSLVPASWATRRPRTGCAGTSRWQRARTSRPLAERSRELARELLDGQVQKLENLGATIAQSHLRMGSAAAEVVELAEGLEAGLVVMGSRGRSEIGRLLMGSVSDAVVRRTPTAR